MAKTVTLEEVVTFMEEHFSQKDENEFKNQLSAFEDKEETYMMGFYEGMVNGLIYAGASLAEIYTQPKVSVDIEKK